MQTQQQGLGLGQPRKGDSLEIVFPKHAGKTKRISTLWGAGPRTYHPQIHCIFQAFQNHRGAFVQTRQQSLSLRQPKKGDSLEIVFPKHAGKKTY